MVLLTSHSNFCKGAYETIGMIVGNENFDYVAFDGSNILEYEKALKQKINLENELIVICTDILSGTPHNTVVKLFSKFENIVIISGYNIPLLISLNFCGNLEDIKKILEEETIKLYKEKKVIEDDENVIL